tara:strand:+ start:489 stop:1490 length:1002 start_codon:yes stop_codon:yes gene_type:complete
MAGVGLGPEQSGLSERAEVTVYQSSLAPAAQRAEKNDIYIAGNKVVLLGLEGSPGGGAPGAEPTGGGGNEFEFSATYGPDVRPNVVAQNVLAPLAQALVRGINGLVVVIGQTASGKTELMRGGGPPNFTFDGLTERALEEVYALLPEEAEAAPNAAGGAGAMGPRHVLNMRYLNIFEERVQDVLQSDCHAHDLKLLDEPHGVVAEGVVPGELKSKPHALGICRQGGAMLQKLQQYHQMDATSAASVFTITLTHLPAGIDPGTRTAGRTAVPATPVAQRCSQKRPVWAAPCLGLLPRTRRPPRTHSQPANAVPLTHQRRPCPPFSPCHPPNRTR